MLCPEVWNFKAPESNFSSQKLKPNERDHLNIVHSFVYNHLVSVVLPDTFKVPESLTQALINDCDYYKLTNVKLSEFVSREFINNFINSGSLYALSIDSHLDCDNCASLTPSGQLILNLDKPSYQSLGLEGSISHFHARTGARYVVTVDLKVKHFKPGKPNYERTKKCLEKLNSDFIITWEAPNENICPSSIAKYFHDLGYQIKLCRIKHSTNTIYSIKVPKIEDDNHYEIVEWLGMISLQADLFSGGPDSYLSTYETPEPNHVIGQVKFLQWRGFFTANQITRLYEELRQLDSSGWVAMYVQGFSDSPVAWKSEEHHFYTNGDNGYVFLLSKDSLICCTHKCSKKRYCNKRKGKPS